MTSAKCWGCGKELPRRSLRYVGHIRLYAAYDKLEITNEDLETDHMEEIKQLIMRLQDEDPKQVTDEIFMEFKLDMCKPCKERFAVELSRGKLPGSGGS